MSDAVPIALCRQTDACCRAGPPRRALGWDCLLTVLSISLISVYMGADLSNPEAIKRNRLPAAR